MKLGFILKITDNGEQESISFNKDSRWANYAVDTRSAIQNLTNFDNTGNIVLFTKFLGNLGYLIGIIKARPKGSARPLDNTTAWIHIPNNCNITPDRLMNVIYEVWKNISQAISMDTERLRQIFDIEYPAKQLQLSATGSIVSANNDKYALRYYRDNNDLMLLIGTGIAQQEYSMFKGIFFVDSNLNIGTNTAQILYDSPKQTCIIEPCAEIDGYTPYIYSQNNCIKFSYPIEVAMGTKLTISLMKNGFAPINNTFTVLSNMRLQDVISVGVNDKKIMIERSQFKIVDERLQDVRNAEIRINGEKMTGDYIALPVSYFDKTLTLTIFASGFNEYRNDNFKFRKGEIKVSLTRHKNKYRLLIPMYIKDRPIKDGVIEFETNYKLEKCPIKGYEMTGGRGLNSERHLHYKDTSSFSLKHLLISFVSGIVITLLILALATDMFSGKPEVKTDNTEEVTDDNNTPEEETGNEEKDTADISKAKKYLDFSKKWEKGELDEFASCQGLYDALNNFELEKLNEINSVINSKKLTDVIEALNTSTKGGKYNKEDDPCITVDKYINYLKEEDIKKEDIKKEDIKKEVKKKEDIKKEVKKKEDIKKEVKKKDKNNHRGV